MAENAAADIMVPLLLSLRVAGLATFFSFVFGVGLAWVMSRRRGPVRSVIDALCTLPMVLPPTVRLLSHPVCGAARRVGAVAGRVRHQSYVFLAGGRGGGHGGCVPSYL